MKIKKLFFLFVLLLFVFSANEKLFAQKRRTPPRRSIIVGTVSGNISAAPRNLPADLQRRYEAFDLAWQTIHKNYFDQTFGGLDWNKMRREYEPRVLKTTRDEELHGILQEMINRLDRSHFAVISPEVFIAIEKAKADAKAKEAELKKTENAEDAPGETIGEEDEPDEDYYSQRFGIGVELRLIDGRFVITRIGKNSAAEFAGLKTGYAIEKINDVSLAELLRKVETSPPSRRDIKRFLPAQIVEWMLNGERDSSVALTYTDETGQAKDAEIRREWLKGETISLGDNFPEQFLSFETASLNEDVGFVKFNLFALPVIEKFCAAVGEFKDKKAIIVDLRGNTGGLLGALVGLGGMLTDKSIDLGTAVYKVGSENMIASAKAKNYKGKLVFLVDNQTVSAAEVFAAAVQENNRALVVGEKTAGEALPAVSVRLPTGAVLVYPIANFKTRNGNLLEGKGVEPNFVVALDRKSLLEGKDNQLETALRLIRENESFPKSLEGVSVGIGGVKLSGAPPPPPLAIPKGKLLGAVNIKAPPPVEVYKKDEKSLKIIAEFVEKIGGEQALSKLNSYTLKGETNVSSKGTTASLQFRAFRQAPDKYAEEMTSAVVGEIREVYTPKKFFVQTDYGVNRDFPIEIDTTRIEIFAPVNQLVKKDFFKSLTFRGTFDRNGRKAHIVEAKTTDDVSIALAFDAETKLLVGYAGQFYTISLSDYRKVENLLLPFEIEREHLMRIKIEEIKLNPLIEASVFEKKENCFDKAGL